MIETSNLVHIRADREAIITGYQIYMFDLLTYLNGVLDSSGRRDFTRVTNTKIGYISGSKYDRDFKFGSYKS